MTRLIRKSFFLNALLLTVSLGAHAAENSTKQSPPSQQRVSCSFMYQVSHQLMREIERRNDREAVVGFDTALMSTAAEVIRDAAYASAMGKDDYISRHPVGSSQHLVCSKTFHAFAGLTKLNHDLVVSIEALRTADKPVARSIQKRAALLSTATELLYQLQHNPCRNPNFCEH